MPRRPPEKFFRIASDGWIVVAVYNVSERMLTTVMSMDSDGLLWNSLHNAYPPSDRPTPVTLFDSFDDAAAAVTRTVKNARKRDRENGGRTCWSDWSKHETYRIAAVAKHRD